MEPSLDREGHERYVRGLWHGVVVQRADFEPAEVFASWWARHGWLYGFSLEQAWATWAERGYPHRDENGGGR